MKNTRNTVAKTEILRLIEASDVALSHAEIQAQVGNLCDRVTIYRVLDRLQAENMIHKIINLDGVVKYATCQVCSTDEKTAHTHKHVHFNCEKCKQVTCLDNVEPTLDLPQEYEVKEMHFMISGVCPNCCED